jgi:hypothetical protein
MLLTQRIGIGAGVLLVLVVAAAVIPPLVVKYRVHAFVSRLHAGMTRDEVNAAARESQLAPSSQSGATMDFDVPPPWSVEAQCRDDYSIVVVMKGERSRSFAQIKNRVCT